MTKKLDKIFKKLDKILDGLETEGDAIAYHDRQDAEQLAEWRHEAIAYHDTGIPMTEVDILKKNVADLQEQLQNSYIKQKSFLDKLHELRKRNTIALAIEMKQLNFDFKPSNEK